MRQRVTSEKLVEVAIELFGRNGFESVTTRAIAEAAGAQQSAISYHFGSKERLYLACAEHIAAEVAGHVVPLVDGLGAVCDAADAGARIEAMLAAMVTLMMTDDIAPLARFVVREQMNPGAAFDVLWERTIRQVAEPLVALLAVVARGRLSQEALRVRAFSLVGQAFAFRFGHASLLRLTGWRAISDRESALAREAVLANARAILADLSGDDARDRPPSRLPGADP